LEKEKEKKRMNLTRKVVSWYWWSSPKPRRIFNFN